RSGNNSRPKIFDWLLVPAADATDTISVTAKFLRGSAMSTGSTKVVQKLSNLRLVARAHARARTPMTAPQSRVPTRYNSDEDELPVFAEMKAEFPTLTFEFGEDAHEPSFRWKAGVYEPKPKRIVLPGSRQSILMRVFRVIAHSATRK